MSVAQCQKRFYLERHRPELATPPSAGDRLRMEMGIQVGNMARRLEGEGTYVPPGNLDEAVSTTSEILGQRGEHVLFEAAFSHSDLGIRTDILRKRKGDLELIEVKSSSRVKPEHWLDCATQAWVIQEAGFPLRSVSLAHVNSEFVYEREGIYDGLIETEELTKELHPAIPSIPVLVRQAREVLSGSEPDVPMGPHCTTPVACPFLAFCGSTQSEYPVRTLPRGRKVADSLIEKGIQDIRDIPAGMLDNPLHERIRVCVISGKPFLEKSLKTFLRSLGYPRYYLDFESIQFAVPRWLGTRPYEQLPFQWSCHKERRDGSVEHFEFLNISGDAPMRSFAETLVHRLGRRGPIIVYSHFEKTIIRQLAERFADFADSLLSIEERLVDLLPLIRKHYYHPAMQGSFSIKSVVSAVVPELSYLDLDEIRDGGAAQAAFVECIAKSTPHERSAELSVGLREYCARDTLVMVELVSCLQRKARNR